MNTYNVNALANVIKELATQGHDGICLMDDGWGYSAKGVLECHFVIDTDFPSPEDYTGCIITDTITGEKLLISNKVLKKNLDVVLEKFSKAVSGTRTIKVEDQYGNYTKYARTDEDYWERTEVLETDEIWEKDSRFILYPNIRHDALVKLTDRQQTVMDAEFHKCFDVSVVIAKQQWEDSKA